MTSPGVQSAPGSWKDAQTWHAIRLITIFAYIIDTMSRHSGPLLHLVNELLIATSRQVNHLCLILLLRLPL